MINSNIMTYQGLSFLYKQETIYNKNSELLTCQTITKQDVYASSLCNYVIWFPNSSAMLAISYNENVFNFEKS